METLAAILLCSALIGNSLEDAITAISAEVCSSEGRSVTLSCTYSVKADNLQWYRQDPGSAPQFLLLITDTTQPYVVEAEPAIPRLNATLNKENKQVDLQISSAAVTDSAVYYCALRPATGGANRKIIFGRGTRVTIETKEEYKPSFYKLEDESTSLCLATGFSRIRAADKDKSGIFNNRTGAVRIEGDSLFSQVGYLSSGQTCETGGGPVDCDDSLQPDPQVNLVSLTVLGLRLLFMKTVVFNVLLTLRLWITS